jgi:hypothetical protein
VAAVLVVLPTPEPRSPAPLPEFTEVSEETVRRLERVVAREQTARYLDEARDVLALVASESVECDRDLLTLDVDEEARRSRDLLHRRALLIETAGDDVASAGPVLADVEDALREVAGFESCIRAADLDQLREAIARRQLLMRIRVMTRELTG